jgi:hypothetical protein
VPATLAPANPGNKIAFMPLLYRQKHYLITCIYLS